MIDPKEVTSEKVVLIGVITQLQDQSQSKEYLDELEFLTIAWVCLPCFLAKT